MQDKLMTTREIVIQSLFEGKRSKFRISDKFQYHMQPVDTNSLVKYVDAALTERESLSDRLGSIDNDVYVSFLGNGQPRTIEFDGEDMQNRRVEVELKLDEFGEVFHYRFVTL